MDRKIDQAQKQAERNLIKQKNAVKDKLKSSLFSLSDKSESEYQSILQKMDTRPIQLFEWVTLNG